MSYRLDGQPLRQLQGSYFNELGDNHRKDREAYMGTLNSSVKAKQDMSIHQPLQSLNTYGARADPGYYRTGLTPAYENTFTNRYQGHIQNKELEKDGNPYHDKYVFSYSVSQKSNNVPLNNGNMIGGCDCSDDEY